MVVKLYLIIHFLHSIGSVFITKLMRIISSKNNYNGIMLKINDFQYKVLTTKLHNNGWDGYSPDQHSISYDPSITYHVWTHPEKDILQKLIFKDSCIYLQYASQRHYGKLIVHDGRTAATRHTWQNFLDYVDLKIELG